jgi:hypothetical protein
MRPTRAISLVAILATIFTGSLTCSPASAMIPECRGRMQAVIDTARGDVQPTPEAAAAQALEITFGTDVRDVVLRHSEGDRFVATTVDGSTLEHAPTVVVEQAEHGFIPAGVLC